MLKTFPLNKLFGFIFMIGLITYECSIFLEIYYSQKFHLFDILFLLPPFLYSFYLIFFLFLAKQNIMTITLVYFKKGAFQRQVTNQKVKQLKKHPLEMILMAAGVVMICEILMLFFFFLTTIKRQEDVKLFYCILLCILFFTPIIVIYVLFCTKNSPLFQILKRMLQFLFNNNG